MATQGQGGVLTGLNPTTYNAADPIPLFIIQVIFIIFFTRILHLVLSRFRQPRVISEVIGGIILGPSVLGHIPGFLPTIFPNASAGYLNLLSNLGLILFLFIVGVELNPTVLVQKAKVALTISAAGIALPFALGIGVGYGLYTQMSETDVPFSSFILFIGVAMSITAFPVLARILSELQLLRTPVGSTALSAGVGDDVAAWVLLALVVTIINASSSIIALYVLLLAVAWFLIVLFVIRPILLKLVVKTGSNDNGPTVTMMVITLSLVLISAFITDIIGVHPIFGGFLIGAIIPHESGFAVGITEKIEDLVSVLFLPIYFTLSGIRTQIGLLNDGKSWGWVFLVIFVAMVGKITGATLAARFNKLAWRESLTIGVFMSCKGLVELIVLNIGLEAEVINPKVFTIMVVMAVVTTIVTTPLATYLYPHEYQRKMELLRNGHLGLEGTQDSISKKNQLLIVLNKVEYLPPMMMIVRLLQPLTATTKQQEVKNDSSITVHVLRLVELTQRISTVMKINENEETLHDPIMNIFRTFGQMNFVKVKANLAVVAQQDFAQHVSERAEDTNANLVIIPWGGAGAIIEDPSNPFVGPKEKKETSSRVAHFTQEVFTEVTVRANVGVFVDRGLGVSSLNPIEHDISIRIFLPFFGGNDDREALSFVVQLLDHPNVSVTILRIKKSLEPTEHDARLERSSTPHIITIESGEKDDGSVENQRPSLAHRVSTASAYILDSKDERDASEIKDEELLTQTLKSRTDYVTSNSRINFSEISSSTPLQTAVKRAKDVVGRKDLVVVGRGRHEATFDHKAEISDILRTLGDYGIDTHKSLGNVAQAFLAGDIGASILVLQAKKTTKLKEIV